MPEPRVVGNFEAAVFFRQGPDIKQRARDWFSRCRQRLEQPAFAGLGDVKVSGSDTGVKFSGEPDLDGFEYVADRSLQLSLVVSDPVAPGEPLAAIRVSLWILEEPDFAKLVCTAYSARLTNFDVAVFLRDALVDYVEKHAVVFGAVAYGTSGGRPSLEGTLRRSWITGLQQAEQVLRGYSWVTVIPSAMAAVVEPRLAGSPLLNASRTGAGDLVVQAGETPQHYDEDAQVALYEAFAPVLPSGTPRRSLEKAAPRGIIYRDAREVAPFHLRVEPT